MKIAYESLLDYSFKNTIDHNYVRVNLANINSVDNFIKNNPNKTKMPILFYPDIKDDIDTVIKAYKKAMILLIDDNYSITLSLDNETALFDFIYRSNTLDFLQRCEHVKNLFIDFAKNISGIILTIEELMPKGMDPYDGVMIAKFLAKCGIKKVIATCGSKNFLLLYDRRKTMPKNHELEICEPKIACGIWLKEHTSLNVGIYINYLDEDHEKYIIEQSKKLGYCEVIFCI